MILVVEDEPGIVDFVERGLRTRGLDVVSELDGQAGLTRALDPEVELVVLDLMLPGLPGAELLRTLHDRRPDLPVIVLTARGEVADRIDGLDAGAVDYIVKPFSVGELAARIRAQLRSASRDTGTELTVDELRINLISREVTLGGEPVNLSTTEFELLVYLARNRSQVLARDQILRAVWGYDHDPGTNIVDVYVGYLRRKLSIGGRTAPITTIRSVGFRFDGAGS
jgi:DNA-binding response OmpR family regulator